MTPSRWVRVAGWLLLLVFGVCGTSEAQDADGPATASLEQVEAANVFAPDEDMATRRVCLNAGAYVLALHIAEGGEFALASLFPEGEDDYLIAATVGFDPETDPESDMWEWTSFKVEEPACFEARVIYGRLRLYSLRVGVSW